MGMRALLEWGKKGGDMESPLSRAPVSELDTSLQRISSREETTRLPSSLV